MEAAPDTDPIGRTCALIARLYLGVLAEKLRELPCERYFLPLLIISRSSGNITQSDLAAAMETDKVTILRMVDYLQAHKLIKRQPDPGDRRQYFLQLTSEGKKVIPQITTALRETEKLACQGMDYKSKKAFNKSLHLVISNLKAAPGKNIEINYRNTTHDKKK